MLDGGLNLFGLGSDLSDRHLKHLAQSGFAGSFLIVQSRESSRRHGRNRPAYACWNRTPPVIGTQALCGAHYRERVAFDMGGTTAKAGVIYKGHVDDRKRAAGGCALPVQIAMMDIFEVSAGGGSIATVDGAGALRVGPQSAGAKPGPACYGLGGTLPTVTDANLILGRLGADRFLGGEMRLDLAAAEAAIRKTVAAPLEMDAATAAAGILRVTVTAMSYAVKGVTTERGLDAGDFTLVAYGGAGPLHATEVARELGIRRSSFHRRLACSPRSACYFRICATTFVRTWFAPLTDAPFDQIEQVYRELEKAGTRGRRQFFNQAARGNRAASRGYALRRARACRYCRSADASVRGAILPASNAASMRPHDLRYGTSVPTEPAEIVSLRSTVTRLLPSPASNPPRQETRQPPAAAFTGTRQACFAADTARRNADVRSPCAARGKPDRRPGADRRACVDDRIVSRRCRDRRCPRNLAIAVGNPT